MLGQTMSIFESFVDQLSDWLKLYMVTPIREQCGNNIVIRKFENSTSFPVGEEWPSMYFHKKLKLLLVIYVDDLKLAGPEENLTKGWEMLRSKLNIEPETDLGLSLGCILRKGSTKLHVGTPVSTMTYDMEGLLKLSVEKYLDIVGKDTKLKHVIYSKST